MANWQLLNQTLTAFSDDNVGESLDGNYDDVEDDEVDIKSTKHLMTVTPSCQPNVDPTSPAQQVPPTFYLCVHFIVYISKRDFVQKVIRQAPMCSSV